MTPANTLQRKLLFAASQILTHTTLKAFAASLQPPVSSGFVRSVLEKGNKSERVEAAINDFISQTVFESGLRISFNRMKVQKPKSAQKMI